MGQKGLVFLEGDGSKYLNQLNFQLHKSLGEKFNSLTLSRYSTGEGGGGFHSPLCKIRSRHPRELKLDNCRAESLYYVLQTMQIQNQAH